MNSDRVCVDASLALAWLLPIQHDDRADALQRRWHANGIQLTGPPMFHAEVISVLREQVFFKRMTAAEGEEGYSVYLDIPIRIIDNPAVYRRAWELAAEHNQRRTYDMQYLAVAEMEDCELWTADKRLYNSLKGKNNRVRWIGERAASL